MSGAFSMVLSMLGMGSAAEPAELSEAYKRACRYIYYKKLCDEAHFDFGMNTENGTALPVHLEGSTMKQVQDSVVKALGAFEEHGEVSLLDKSPLFYLHKPEMQNFLCSGLEGLPDRAKVERGLVVKLARPMITDIVATMLAPPVGMLPEVFLEVTDEPPDAEASDALNAVISNWVIGATYFVVGGPRYRWERRVREDLSGWDLAMIDTENPGGEVRIRTEVEAAARPDARPEIETKTDAGARAVVEQLRRR